MKMTWDARRNKYNNANSKYGWISQIGERKRGEGKKE